MSNSQAKVADDLTDKVIIKFDNAIDTLSNATALAKARYQDDIFQIAELLFESDKGMRALYERANRFDEAGVFLGGPWADLHKLQPSLVAGGLQASGVYPIVEILSELRMLSIAKGKGDQEIAKFCTDFLNEVMTLNLEYLFPGHSEAERISAGPQREACLRLFALLSEELDLGFLLGEVVEEIEQICLQRPLMTTRLRKMIVLALKVPNKNHKSEAAKKLKIYSDAINRPSQLSQKHVELAAYRQSLKECDASALGKEAHIFGESMKKTGLSCPHHAVLLRHLSKIQPDLIKAALALNERGEAELNQNLDFVTKLIKVCIFPTTVHCIYGFSNFLEYGLLSRQEISIGLERIIDLDFQAHVKRTILAQREKYDGVTANSLLVAGVIAMFGQPLGIGQGRNPTCQAARALSLWSQHAHGYLIELLISASRDGFIELQFEGESIRTDTLVVGVAKEIIYDMDVVSIVLVPHLDLLYNAMMQKVLFRQEDGHKWVNPAMYGRWVPKGFTSVFADLAQTTIGQYEDFVRQFYATHHPAYNDGHALMYPNPAGILVTNSLGDYLGPHAISIQRVAEDSHGVLRIYFYNPNNEGRQNWGNGVAPTVSGNDEIPGESSLPFQEFVSRLYAFHFNPYEEGDGYAVPDASINEIKKYATESWGRAFSWSD